VSKAIRGGPARVEKPTASPKRNAAGKLVMAEGGMVGDAPILRYPEDFS